MATGEAGMTLRGKKLLFLVTEDWALISHRLPLALAAMEQGMHVLVLARTGDRADDLRSLGLEVHHVPFERGSLNPLSDAALLMHIVRLYRQLRPDVVHHVALKPVIYGGLAARLTGMKHVVNALPGLGFVFSSSTLTARVLKPFVRTVLRTVLAAPGSRLILQNRDDVRMFTGQGLAPADSIRFVPGVGVDLDAYKLVPEPGGLVRIVLPARMLVDKGVHEYVAAARLLRKRGVDAQFVLVGGIDADNPAALKAEQLRAWETEGLVTWAGHCTDMPSMLASAHIVCLPSYREGLPKALLEACAAARPIVTTDVPGCREVVRDGENGLLVRARDAQDLADKLAVLIGDPALRLRMGQAGRRIAEREYSAALSSAQTIAIYRELL
jgi:glycosyltransferase involved in cell wall biosynthesis